MQYRLAEKINIFDTVISWQQKHSICKVIVLSGFPGDFYTFVHNKEADNDGVVTPLCAIKLTHKLQSVAGNMYIYSHLISISTLTTVN